MTRIVTTNPQKYIIRDELLAARLATTRDALRALLGGSADLAVIAIQEMEELIDALDKNADEYRELLGVPPTVNPAGAAPCFPTAPKQPNVGGATHAVQ